MIEDYDWRLKDKHHFVSGRKELKCCWCLNKFVTYYDCYNALSYTPRKLHVCPYCDSYCITDARCSKIEIYEKQANIFKRIRRLFI